MEDKKENGMQKNPVVFWELASHDMQKSVDFFREVFDWQIEFDDRLGFYVVPDAAPSQAGLDAAVFTLKHAKLPFLTLYIQVEDINAKAQLVQEKGGFIVEEPFDISPKSRICLFNEPSGVTFAMIQSKQD
jgi:predicted enzyme related to lactoylglutathione lyase